MRGKLIVIEGTDAVGKRTQAELLAAHLRKAGKRAEIINFPTYGSGFGKLIRKYLHGGLGGKDALDPELVAMLYALDRYQYGRQLRSKLRSGIYMICNRYSQSNLYQAAKLKGKERAGFIKWVEALESRLPAADAVIFLNLPASASRRLLLKRRRKIDVHERDRRYQEEVRKLYLQEARRNGWIVIDCLDGAGLKGKRRISREIAYSLGKLPTIGI